MTYFPKKEHQVLIATEDTPEDLKKFADIVCPRNPTLVTDCEDAWTPGDPDVTCSTSTDRVEGSYSAQMDVSIDYIGTGGIASYTLPASLDLSAKSGIGLYTKVINDGTYLINPDYLQLKVYDSANTLLATYNLGIDLNLNASLGWTELTFVFGDPSNFTDVAKIELYKNKDFARNFTIFIDFVQGKEWKDQNTIADKLEEQKGKTRSTIVLLPGTYMMDAAITNASTGDFSVEINGCERTAVLECVKTIDYFNLSFADNITLKELRGVRGDKIYLSDNCLYFKMLNCDFKGVVYGEGDHILLAFNHFESQTTTFFYILSSHYCRFIGNYINCNTFDIHEGCSDMIVVGNIFEVVDYARIGWDPDIIFCSNLVHGSLRVGPRTTSIVAGNRCDTLNIAQNIGDSGSGVRIIGNTFGNYVKTYIAPYTEIDFSQGYNYFCYNTAAYA